MLYDFCTDVFNNGREDLFPIELEAEEHDSSAIGFITPGAYDKLGWDLEFSGLHGFVASIMDDMEQEEKLAFHSYESNGVTYHIYEFKGLKIWLNR